MANLTCIHSILILNFHLLFVHSHVGYRHIGLRNECNQPQGVATLFVRISVKDYIPDAFAGKLKQSVNLAVSNIDSHFLHSPRSVRASIQSGSYFVTASVRQFQ